MKQTSVSKLQKQISNKVSILILAFCTTLIVLYVSYKPVINVNIFFELNQTNTILQPRNDSNDKKCDLFKGRWIPDAVGPLYTNYSCPTIPLQRNCFLNGRENADFLNWKWKPDECELSRFSPEAFFRVVRGKTMAFIGDSLARNHANSLICLLSTAETPRVIHMDTEKEEKFFSTQNEKKFTTWEFPAHKFTIMSIWSQFFVSATEQIINGSTDGSYNLTLDKPDTIWSNKLPIIDYAIFSGFQWFPRPHYLYESDTLIGCVYCREPNMTSLGPGLAIRRTIRTAFAEINKCENCKKIFTIMRTASPQHFENGVWNAGGRCNRTRLIEREDIDMDRADWEYRKIQLEELELAKKLGGENGNAFEIVDVTEMMLMRPDAHPDVHSGSMWIKGFKDCVHWCLPGPIDFWSELLLEVIRREKSE